MTGDDFQILARKCQEKGSLVIVDSSGEGLQAVSQLDHLFLIKPNCEELAQITGQNVEDEDEILRVARSLLPQVQLVAVTAGARGAHLVSSAGVWRIVPPDTRQRVINTVGCGDALLAGFVHRYAAGAAPEEAMRYGVATGTASSFQVRSGEVELDDVTTCYEHVTLEKIDQNPG
jgi:fructose-1-phosphate kinase PfkB-like protein